MEVEQPPSIQQQPKPKQQHLEWRRNRVLELTSQGRTEREVASPENGLEYCGHG
jgi:hypothetical protein